MIAAGTSVISSQKNKNVSASRAHTTPTRATTKAALRTPVTRPAAGARHIRRRIDERRASNERQREQKHTAQPVDPNLRRQLARERAAPAVSTRRAPTARPPPKAPAASSLKPQSASDLRTRGAERAPARAPPERRKENRSLRRELRKQPLLLDEGPGDLRPTHFE